MSTLNKSLINKWKHTFSKDRILSTLLKGSALSFLSKTIGALLSFVLQMIIARILGVKDYGNYIYVLTWANLLMLIGIFGFDNTSLRFIPVYRNKGSVNLLKGFMGFSTFLVTGLSILVSLLFITFILIFHLHIKENLYDSLLLSAAAIPLLSLIALYTSRLRAFKSLFLSLTPQQIWNPLLLILSILVFNHFHRLNAQFVLLLYVCTLIVTFVFLWMNQKQVTREARKEKKGLTHKKEWVQVAFSFFSISGFNLLISKTDILLVGYFLSTADAGIYSVATKVASVLVFGLGAINFIIVPMISELYADKKLDALQRLITQSTRLIAITSFPILVVILLFGHLILSFFGKGFEGGYTVLVIISIGQLINALSGSVGFLMNMTGHHKLFVQVLGLSSLINVLLIFLLVRPLGVEGAAFSTSITIIAWNVTLILLVKKHIGINVLNFRKSRR